VLALLLVACSLGLSNFAASVALGAGGVNARTVARVAVVFGVFEAGMPVAGLLLGRRLAHLLGAAAHWTGGALLIAAGAYALAQAVAARRGRRRAPAGRGTRDGAGASPVALCCAGWRLVLAGLALSLDNLTVGFALGTYHVNLAVAAAVIGTVSVALSVTGLAVGSRLGRAAGRRGELLAGIILIGTGAAILAGAL
jgi:manganese efflux pump family protein